MNNSEVNVILKAFKAKFPKPDPQKIFKTQGGYLIVAYLVDRDAADPIYYVSDDLKEVVHFNMAKIKLMFEAFDKGAIWEKQ